MLGFIAFSVYRPFFEGNRSTGSSQTIILRTSHWYINVKMYFFINFIIYFSDVSNKQRQEGGQAGERGHVPEAVHGHLGQSLHTGRDTQSAVQSPNSWT